MAGRPGVRHRGCGVLDGAAPRSSSTQAIAPSPTASPACLALRRPERNRSRRPAPIPISIARPSTSARAPPRSRSWRPRKGPNPARCATRCRFARTARECAMAGATMIDEGRRAGAHHSRAGGRPGQVDVPAAPRGGAGGVEPKTIWTKFYKIPVVLPPGQTNVPFHLCRGEHLAFPVPNVWRALRLRGLCRLRSEHEGTPPAKKKGRSKSR